MTSEKPEYDGIGKQYQQATKRPLRKFSYEPTLRKYLPNLKGKRVLDLACGDGVVTRILRELGASEIVGLDLSNEMINLAKKQDSDKITYLQRDCMRASLRDLGKFDFTTGMMFLHYASTRADLESTVKNIRASLKDNGTFYGLLVNPSLLISGYNQYGVIMPKVEKEGQEVLIQLCDFEGNKFCDIKDYFWKKETYEELFKQQGFDVSWKKGIVSQEGIESYGKEFWKSYLENPLYVMLEAKLKGGLK
jgi:SAM-dependent methyltransferase